MQQQILMFCVIMSVLHIECGPPPCRVEDMGILIRDKDKSIAGMDGCATIPISDTVTMWTFGDTVIGSWKNGAPVETFEESAVAEGMLGNSLAFTAPPSDSTAGSLKFHFYRKDGTVAEFIQTGQNERKRGVRIWAIDGIRLGDAVYVYYMAVNAKTGDQRQPFILSGVGIAQWKIPPGWKIGDPVSFRRLADLFHGNEPTFGDSVIQKDNVLYLIGHKKTGPRTISAFMARVAPGSITDRSAYQFLAGNGSWEDSSSNARGFFHDIAGELTLTYNRHLNTFIIIYCSLNGEIKAAIFSDISAIGKCRPFPVYKPDPLPRIKDRPLFFYYSGKEIFHTEKNIYAIYINPAMYQPMLLKIPNCSMKEMYD